MPKNELTGQLIFKPQSAMNTQITLSSTETHTLDFTDLPPQNFSAVCAAKLETLKNQLVRRLTAEFSDLQAHRVRQAVNEAHALASLTIVPHLFLPTLAEEKVQGLRKWYIHQAAIYPHSAFAFAA